MVKFHFGLGTEDDGAASGATGTQASGQGTGNPPVGDIQILSEEDSGMPGGGNMPAGQGVVQQPFPPQQQGFPQQGYPQQPVQQSPLVDEYVQHPGIAYTEQQNIAQSMQNDYYQQPQQAAPAPGVWQQPGQGFDQSQPQTQTQAPEQNQNAFAQPQTQPQQPAYADPNAFPPQQQTFAPQPSAPAPQGAQEGAPAFDAGTQENPFAVQPEQQPAPQPTQEPEPAPSQEATAPMESFLFDSIGSKNDEEGESENLREEPKSSVVDPLSSLEGFHSKTQEFVAYHQKKIREYEDSIEELQSLIQKEHDILREKQEAFERKLKEIAALSSAFAFGKQKEDATPEPEKEENTVSENTKKDDSSDTRENPFAKKDTEKEEKDFSAPEKSGDRNRDNVSQNEDKNTFASERRPQNDRKQKRRNQDDSGSSPQRQEGDRFNAAPEHRHEDGKNTHPGTNEPKSESKEGVDLTF